MFTDPARDAVREQLRQRDLRVFHRFLSPALLVQAAGRAGLRVGRSALALPHLAWLAIAAAWHPTKDFASVLGLTLKLLTDAGQLHTLPTAPPLPPGRSKHDPRRADATAITEEAFVQARQRIPWRFWVALVVLLSDRFEQDHGPRVRWKQFRLLALDGTCITLPQWSALGDEFGRAKNGKSKGRIQARLVMLQLPLVRMPWRFELTPVTEGERTVAGRLVPQLRPDDLVLMDQGFWSYGLFYQIQQQKAFFAIRLHPQVRPHCLRRLGPQDRLVRWRKPSGPRWRGDAWPPALDLRVIHYQVRGFRPSAVVTNILDPQLVSRDEWIHLATQTQPGAQRLDQGLYHRRWEIETTFEELKVVQGMEGQLRSRTPASLRFEVAGQVVLYLLLRWLMVEAAAEADLDPLALSFRHALAEVGDLQWALVTSSPERVATELLPRLRERMRSHRVPFRPGRHYPRPHDTKTKNTGRGSKRRKPHKLARGKKKK